MVLAVFAGLPGVGKSSLARQVGAALPAVVLAVDAVDAKLRQYEVSEPRPGYAAYGVVVAFAETQLELGHHVIIDAVSPVPATRRLWADLAERRGVPLRVVEVVRSSDDDMHGKPVDWEPYIGPRLVVDTDLAKDPVEAILGYLS